MSTTYNRYIFFSNFSSPFKIFNFFQSVEDDQAQEPANGFSNFLWRWKEKERIHLITKSTFFFGTITYWKFGEISTTDIILLFLFSDEIYHSIVFLNPSLKFVSDLKPNSPSFMGF
jgi:hypothetical protein